MTNAHHVNIMNTTFNNNKAYHGGAVYLDNISDLTLLNTHLIDNCIFDSNTAEQAGAIYTNNIILNITNSHFTNNTALGSDKPKDERWGSGGALDLL